uniref:Uncharacterized protein n=1 Tax=Echeneis naucrates TaxID=173247 RepID=A0A665TA69_ECHNA
MQLAPVSICPPRRRFHSVPAQVQHTSSCSRKHHTCCLLRGSLVKCAELAVKHPFGYITNISLEILQNTTQRLIHVERSITCIMCFTWLVSHLSISSSSARIHNIHSFRHFSFWSFFYSSVSGFHFFSYLL